MFFFFIYLHCETHHKSPYNLRFGPGKVLEKSLVLTHQNLWEPCAIEIGWSPHALDRGTPNELVWARAPAPKNVCQYTLIKEEIIINQ